jgi:hypothetical protein
MTPVSTSAARFPVSRTGFSSSGRSIQVFGVKSFAEPKGRDCSRSMAIRTHRRFYSKNYAFKLDYNFNPSHQLNFSIFGDPTITNKAPHNSLNIDNTTANSVLDFGTRNTAVRYNGALTPSWTASVAFSQGTNRFDESGFDNFAIITDRTGQPRGDFRAVGLGFFEPTDSTTYRTTADTQKVISFLGTHTFGFAGLSVGAGASDRRPRHHR